MSDDFTIIEITDEYSNVNPSVIEVGIQGPPGVSATGREPLSALVFVTSADTSALLATLPAGARIKSIQLRFTRLFDDPFTTVSIGHDSDPEAFVKISDNRPTFPDEFDYEEEFLLTQQTDVKVFISATLGTLGVCEASIIYTKE